MKIHNKKIIFAWIPSQVGIKENKPAERAAKEAASSALEITNIFTSSDYV